MQLLLLYGYCYCLLYVSNFGFSEPDVPEVRIMPQSTGLAFGYGAHISLFQIEVFYIKGVPNKEGLIPITNKRHPFGLFIYLYWACVVD